MLDLERGRREAHEGRETLAKLARREAEDASATRKRLELGSGAGAGRRDAAGILNAMAAKSVSREMPGLDALAAIRKNQRLNRKSAQDHNRAHERFEKQGGLEGYFNRLHPASDLRRDDVRSSDARAQDYDPGRDVSAIEAEFLLEAAKVLIEAARERARLAPADRRDG